MGLRKFFFARGCRSTRVRVGGGENRAFFHHTVFEEPVRVHMGLGLAKATNAPVAVIVTSGTAVANLYP
ncbi:2-succinyl-5-enolpyruvyl-6-hydroxy-3-cyclohexene-1-carboxylic-acid synthase, partial [Enterobacter mori]